MSPACIGGPRWWAVPLLTLLLGIPAPGCSQSPESTSQARGVVEDLQPEPESAPGSIAALSEGVDASRRNAIVVAAERISPAVVSVNVVRRERVVPRSLFEEMMLPPNAQREVPGLGSGFVIHQSGIVLTNEHVVRGADELAVTLPDGREFRASVIGVDEVSDLAVLRLDLPQELSQPLPVAPLGDSDDLMIGEWVVAIGNPLGFLLANTEPSVTVGVISAVRRNIVPGYQQRGYYLDMVQTDASINPGNSGGPLINALGQVVGVNASILSSGGGSEGLGFAIPINRARRVVEDLLEGGRVRRAWVGANAEGAPTATSRTAEVRLTSIVPGSPADRAGLREGMVVRSVGGRTVRSALDWEAGLLQGRVGQPLGVEVADGNGSRSVQVVPEDLPSVSADRIQALRDIELVTLTPAIQAERGLASPQGALVVGLADAALQTGLREGDVILQINRLRITSAEEAAAALASLRGQGVAIYFERDGRLVTTSFRIG